MRMCSAKGSKYSFVSTLRCSRGPFPGLRNLLSSCFSVCMSRAPSSGEMISSPPVRCCNRALALALTLASSTPCPSSTILSPWRSTARVLFTPSNSQGPKVSKKLMPRMTSHAFPMGMTYALVRYPNFPFRQRSIHTTCLMLSSRPSATCTLSACLAGSISNPSFFTTSSLMKSRLAPESISASIEAFQLWLGASSAGF